jgi:hypothetical protein
MIPISPIIIVFIIAYKIYDKITEDDIKVDWNLIKMSYIVIIIQ